MEDRTGQQIGNYRLVRQLGEGGFAEVYLGEHIHLGTQAAIKVLRTRLNHEDYEQFRAEARTVAHLVHPHIVRVLDFGVEDATPFLIMDYAPGGTLRSLYPRRSRVSLSSVRTYVAQIASALHYAHQHKVIHRDIKPENMLLNAANEVVLSDFGISLVSQSSRYQSTQDIAGTGAYMAPEQLQGKPRPASDQYALGIVIYEWLCGERPFHGSFVELCSQHLLVSPPSFAEKDVQLAPEIEQVVRTALAKDPAERFSSMEAFAHAFEQACQPDDPQEFIPTFISSKKPAPVSLPLPSVQTDTPSPQTPFTVVSSALSSPPREQAGKDRPQVPKRTVSRRVALWGLASTATAVVGGSLTWLVLSKKIQPFPGILLAPPTPTPGHVGMGTTLLVFRGHAEAVTAVTWSPDSTRLAVAGGKAEGNASRFVEVWKATTGQILATYKGHASRVDAVSWSPDNQRVVSGGEDQTVQVWNATTGSQIFTYRDAQSSPISSVAWSPNGGRIAARTVYDTVDLLDAVTGKLIATNMSDSGGGLVSAAEVAWSPDSQRIAFVGGDNAVRIWDITSGQTVAAYTGYMSTTNGDLSSIFAVVWSPDGRYIASATENRSLVDVWDAATGNTVFTYHGHVNTVTSVAWSPDSKRLASGSFDTTVQVWDALDGARAFTYHSHANAVWSVAWSPDGTRIASGDNNQTVHVWQAV